MRRRLIVFTFVSMPIGTPGLSRLTAMTSPTCPFRSPRRSLKHNSNISDQAKQAVRDAAGSGVSIEF